MIRTLNASHTLHVSTIEPSVGDPPAGCIVDSDLQVKKDILWTREATGRGLCVDGGGIGLVPSKSVRCQFCRDFLKEPQRSTNLWNCRFSSGPSCADCCFVVPAT